MISYTIGSDKNLKADALEMRDALVELLAAEFELIYHSDDEVNICPFCNENLKFGHDPACVYDRALQLLRKIPREEFEEVRYL